MGIPDGKTEEDKDDFIFVHWKQIQSSDEWPTLQKGQKVEYYLGKKLNPKDPKKANFAAKVTLPGGEQVKVADGVDVSPSLKDKTEVEFALYKVEDEDKKAKKGAIYVCRDDFKPRRAFDPNRKRQNRKRKRNQNQKGKGKKGKKGRNQKFNKGSRWEVKLSSP